MSTKSNTSASKEAYQALLDEFGTAIKDFHEKKYNDALKKLDKLAKSITDEPELTDRIQAYTRMCKAKLETTTSSPSTPNERYHAAVLAMNNGDLQTARALLDQTLQETPQDPTVLYARACVHALGSDAMSAIQDLRAAIAIDPKLRFQAVNDPDFQPIREDAAFIDVIEPSVTGV